MTRLSLLCTCVALAAAWWLGLHRNGKPLAAPAPRESAARGESSTVPDHTARLPVTLPAAEAGVERKPAPSALTGEAAHEQLRKDGHYESLAAAFQAARYAAEKIDPAGTHSRGAEYFAANPAQELRAWFRHDGVELAGGGREKTPDAEPWSVALRLRASGRMGDTVDAGPRTVRAQGGRVEMADAAGALIEWYENRREGLEQGFTVARAPGGDGPLELALAVEGNLRAEPMASEKGEGVRFVRADGEEIVHYTGLKAWDASGRVLPARMELRGAELALLVNDDGAQYPVTVDPLFAHAEARLSQDVLQDIHFGYSVALSGDIALVGAETQGAPAIGAAYIFVHSGAGWILEQKLTPSDGATSRYNLFGRAVALSGTTALVAAPGNASDQGGVYVYVRSGAHWSEQTKLTAADGEVGDRFGSAVAVDGETALVGADRDDNDSGGDAGSAYVFVRSGTLWSQQSKLIVASQILANPAPIAINDGVPSAPYPSPITVEGVPGNVVNVRVSLRGVRHTYPDDIRLLLVSPSGRKVQLMSRAGGGVPVADVDLTFADNAAVSIPVGFPTGTYLPTASDPTDLPAPAPAGPYPVTLSTFAGEAANGVWKLYVHDRYPFGDTGGIDQGWALEIQTNTSPTVHRVGSAVALSGDTALVGASSGEGNESNAGRAFVFVRSGASWTLQANLAASDGAPGNNFGFAAALQGDTALVGAQRAGGGDGAAYVFVRNGTTWSQQSRLSSSGGQFGAAVSLSGETALVGAPFAGPTGGGTATVFTRDGALWSQQMVLSAIGDGVFGDVFGFSVALSGETALVSAWGAAAAAGGDAGKAEVWVRSGATWFRQTEILPGDGPNSDYLGKSLAVSGDTAVVGAYRDSTPTGAFVGAAYVFVRTGTTWREQAKLAATDLLSFSFPNFGWSVDLAGDTAVIGAPFHEFGGGPGKAYVFVRTGDFWDEQAQLLAADVGISDQYGLSVAVAANTALIGSPYHANGRGAAYVFFRNGTSWSQQAKLTGNAQTFSNPAPILMNDNVPSAPYPSPITVAGVAGNVGNVRVSLHGLSHTYPDDIRVLLISPSGRKVQLMSGAGGGGGVSNVDLTLADDAASPIPSPVASGMYRPTATDGSNFPAPAPAAPYTTTLSTFAGEPANGVWQLYVHDRYAFSDSGAIERGWTLEITPANAPTAAFGHAVAVRVNTALVGAPSDDTTQASRAGSAYVFLRSGANWTQQAKLAASDGTSGDFFGGAVALSPNTALVGAPNDDSPTAFDAGSAYVFVRSNAIWNEQAKLTASAGGAFDNFGTSVALNNDTALVGAPNSDAFGIDAGSAHVFVRSGTLWAPQTTMSSGVEATAGDNFGNAVALSGSTAIVGAISDSTIAGGAGTGYVYLLGELPNITQQPLSRTVLLNTPVTFSVTVTGYAPLNFQWRKNGSDISGANAASYSIPSAQVADQGTYDVVVSNIGGLITSAPAILTVNALSELTQVFPGGVGLGARQGSLKVNLIVPAGIVGAGWRLVGEQVWHLPGEVVFGLTTSDRAVEFRPVANALQPLREDTVSVVSGQQTVLEREYFQTSGGATGGLTVILKPDGLAGAQWRLVGEDDTAWRNSGVLRPGLLAGVYLVECRPVAGRSTPPPLSVSVLAGQTPTATATYFLFVPPPGTPPGVLPFETVSTSATLPYAYVGQIRSEAGASTGFVVRPRVVATAGHVVFDDSTLMPTVGVQWLFQRDAGTYEPTPQTPRGFYLRAGYAAQRTLEATPGTSAPASQNLDAAALYFLAPAGRVGSPADDPLQQGGYAGFLASDAADNEWLLSNASKTLVGYPVDGDFAASAGRMHATPPADVTFLPAFERTYTTTAIRSAGGNSGGPLCVQFENGKYYPTAIYLGGSGQSVVRAIDTDVINLFNAATISGNGGTNQTSGGVIQGDAVATGSIASPASIMVDMRPAAAVNGGARWRLGLSSAALYGDEVQVGNLTPGNYTLYFSDVAGYAKPPPTPVTLVGGQMTPMIGTYVLDDAITTHPSNQTSPAFENVSLSVAASGTPTAYRWQRNGVDLINGANANGTTVSGAGSATLTLSNIKSADAGNYTCRVTWASGPKTSNPGVLTVTKIAQALTFPVLANRYLAEGSFNVTALAGSELPVTFQVLAGGSATLSAVTETPTGSRVTVTPTGFGTVTVRANQAGDGDYNPVTKDRSFMVSGDTLDLWRARSFTASQLADTLLSGPLADLERDGVNTLLEFALNSNPQVPDRSTMIAGTGTRGLPLYGRESAAPFRATVEYVRRRAASTPGITYQIEFTSSLNPANWTVTGTEVVTAIDATWERVKVTDSAAAAATRYGRLKITMP